MRKKFYNFMICNKNTTAILNIYGYNETLYIGTIKKGKILTCNLTLYKKYASIKDKLRGRIYSEKIKKNKRITTEL